MEEGDGVYPNDLTLPPAQREEWVSKQFSMAVGLRNTPRMALH